MTTEQPTLMEWSDYTQNNSLLDRLLKDFAEVGFVVDPVTVHRFVASLLAKRFVILTGLSGSGKTKLAQAFAYWLSQAPYSREEPESRTEEGGPTAAWLPIGAELPSGRVFYRVDAIDSLAVEFSNERGEGRRTKVTLPKGLIDEWVRAIQVYGFTRDTTARTIREAVAQTTEYSTQLNSFETHLKVAAFAILEEFNQTSPGPEHSKLGPTSKASAEDDRPPLLMSQSSGSFTIVAVGADWNSSEHVLGYPDAFDPSRFVTTPVLDLILRAETHPAVPHFLILDEMNMSHVERYFADFLSSVESGEPIHLYGGEAADGNEPRSGIPSEMHLPPNLFVIGTVNVDETTYMFSPKVLDRANTIEFVVSERSLNTFLANPRGIHLGRLFGRGMEFVPGFVQAARETHLHLEPDLCNKLNSELLLFFQVLAEHGLEFGFRTALEIRKFIHHYLVLGSGPADLNAAIDAQICQKFLPRLNGSRSRLEPVLRSLAVLCTRERIWGSSATEAAKPDNYEQILAEAHQAGTSSVGLHEIVVSQTSAIYPLALRKVQRMERLLRQNGFTSFAEA